MLEIRKATINDAADIAALGRITFTQSFGHLFRDKEDLKQYLDSTFSFSKIENSLTKNNNIYWIAIWKEKPVAYAKLKLNSKTDFVESHAICQLQKIYVLKDFISKKIGTELQSTLLDEAKTLNFKSIWLSVLRENERAIQFYNKNGFTKVGDHEFRIGKEVFNFKAMAKSL